jgi:hypothetical protein
VPPAVPIGIAGDPVSILGIGAVIGREAASPVP